MIKYVSIAAALKFFSSNSLLRSAYRTLGNKVGNKRRSAEVMPGYYPDRAKWGLRLVRQYQTVRDGARIIELGTGWLHWEALTLRLFFEIEAVVFDVWDNRQLGGLKNYARQLEPILPLLNNELALSATELRRAQSLIESIINVESFAELYKLLHFEYVVESSGSLSQFPSNSFDLVVSGGVLEHVKKEAVGPLIEDTRRILKPGAWAVHSIDTGDHLEHYDKTVSPKKYLSYSDKVWTRLFENEIQYINRLQRGEWLQLFDSHG